MTTLNPCKLQQENSSTLFSTLTPKKRVKWNKSRRYRM